MYLKHPIWTNQNKEVNCTDPSLQQGFPTLLSGPNESTLNEKTQYNWPPH
jgi:hypothetical protein